MPVVLRGSRTHTDSGLKLIANARRNSRRNRIRKAGYTPNVLTTGGLQPKLAVLFPGRVRSGRRQSARTRVPVPEVLDTLANANAAVAELQKNPTPAGFGPHLPTDDLRHSAEERVRTRTPRHAKQPGIARQVLGVANSSSCFGLKADAFSGHTYGELVALRSGRMSESDLYQFRLRAGN